LLKRVVISGVGVIAPNGLGKEAFWQALISGKSGIDEIKSFDASPYPVRIAGEVSDFEPSEFLDHKEIRRLDRFCHFAVASSGMALRDAGLSDGTFIPERAGVIVSSGIGGIITMEKQHIILREQGPRRLSPFVVPMMIVNMASGHVSIRYGLKGPNMCIVTACATGTNSIGEAFRMVKYGTADVMLAGGAEAAISGLGIGGFCASKTLSTRNDEPERASRPFDKDRDGFVMGEGCGVVVLEQMEHALKRGARIYAEVVGYGATADAYHMTTPDLDGDGATRAMNLAIDESGLKPSDVDYINAHGTSTDYNDKIETLAVKKVFGESAYEVAISSTKSMTGHLLGAAGGVEAVVTALTIEAGVIPPTINYETPDPECDLDYTPNKAVKRDVKVAMSNSFGFGGQNAVLIFKSFSA
jgi:3-oxoacyl-[acyl-carrier-protein] synthase II